MSRPNTQFTYTPLTNPSTEIRLLTIHPYSPSTSPLSCTLTHHPLHPKPIYTCLSYTWGPDTPDQQISISINNAPLQIRPNLALFMRVARRVGFTDLLWVDAVCINQGDTEEKNQQVMLMGQIYGGAFRTVVWLGLEGSDGDGLREIERWMLERVDGEEVQEWRDVHPGDEYFGIAEKDERTSASDFARSLKTRKILLTDCIRNRMLFRKLTETNLYTRWHDRTNANDLILRFAAAAYWTRAWIVQEIVLSRQSVMLCSGGVVDVTSILPLAVMVIRYLIEQRRQGQEGSGKSSSSSNHDLFQVEQDVQFIAQRLLQKQQYQHQHQDTTTTATLPPPILLDEALSLTWSRQCADIKDRVFSILSISDSDSDTDTNPKFQVNYAQTPQELMLNLVIFAAERGLPGNGNSNEEKGKKEKEGKKLQSYLSMVAWAAAKALQIRPLDESQLGTLESWLREHKPVVSDGQDHGHRMFWVKQQSWGGDDVKARVPVASTCFVLRIKGVLGILECRFDASSMTVYLPQWWVERNGKYEAET